MKGNQTFETVDFNDLTSNSIDFGNCEPKDIVIAWETVIEIFKNLKSHGSYVLIKNFPVEASFYLNFMSLFGNPVPQDTKGTIIGEVKHEVDSYTGVIKRGHKSNKKLEFHNDRCDIFGLLCSSSAKDGGFTILVEAKDIYDEIKKNRPDLLMVLECNYTFDLRDDQRGDKKSYEMPVFMHMNNQLIVRYIRKFINSAQEINGVPKISPIQIEALNYLDKMLDNQMYHSTFRLEKGDLLLLNNLTTLHSRTGFVDTFESKRLLLRIWLSNPQLSQLPNSFKALFGNDLNSGVRGGIRLNSLDDEID